MVHDVTDNSFNNDVINSDIPVIVDFWAEWCGPCRQLAPILTSLSEKLEGKVKIVKINIDENTETPQTYGVRGIPTLILFKGGKTVATKVGALPESTLTEWINSNI